MNLTKTDVTEDYPHLRLVSENEIWEVGIAPLTIFGGIRIVAGKVGSECYEINYCAGTDKGMAFGVLAQVIAIMSKLPEVITPGDFNQIFPIQHIKPMIDDPQCWERLSQLANNLHP